MNTADEWALGRRHDWATVVIAARNEVRLRRYATTMPTVTAPKPTMMNPSTPIHPMTGDSTFFWIPVTKSATPAIVPSNPYRDAWFMVATVAIDRPRTLAVGCTHAR